MPFHFCNARRLEKRYVNIYIYIERESERDRIQKKMHECQGIRSKDVRVCKVHTSLCIARRMRREIELRCQSADGNGYMKAGLSDYVTVSAVSYPSKTQRCHRCRADIPQTKADTLHLTAFRLRLQKETPLPRITEKEHGNHSRIRPWFARTQS